MSQQDKCNNSDLEEEPPVKEDYWLDFFRSKQSDQLNVMAAIGIAYIFGVFNIPRERGFVFVPFSLLILAIFLYFLSR